MITARSAARDRNNHVIAQAPPGMLAELVGAEVVEFTAKSAFGNALYPHPFCIFLYQFLFKIRQGANNIHTATEYFLPNPHPFYPASIENIK